MPQHSTRGMKAQASLAPLALAIFCAHPLGAQQPTQAIRLSPVAFTSPTSDLIQALQRSLIRDQGARLWMLVMPSFSPASALELDCTWNKADEPKSASFTIRWTEALDQTWLWSTPPPPPAPGATPWKMPSHFKSRTGTAPVPPEAAQEIIHAWVHLLRETRYPTENEFISGNDGSTFEFYAWWDRMSGRGQSLMGWTWSPASGPTKMLVDLGQGLIAYAKASPKDRQALLAKCMDLAKAIQAYEYK